MDQRNYWLKIYIMKVKIDSFPIGEYQCLRYDGIYFTTCSTLNLQHYLIIK